MHQHITCEDAGERGISPRRAYEVVVHVVPTDRAKQNPGARGVFEFPTCICAGGEMAADDHRWYPPGHFAQEITFINE